MTAGTILHRTKLPLLMWLWAVYLLIQDKRGISAKQLSRESTCATQRHGSCCTSADGPSSNLKASLAPGTNLFADGWAIYIKPGKDFVHEATVLTNLKDAGIRLPLVHI